MTPEREAKIRAAWERANAGWDGKQPKYRVALESVQSFAPLPNGSVTEIAPMDVLTFEHQSMFDPKADCRIHRVVCEGIVLTTWTEQRPPSTLRSPHSRGLA